MPEQSRPLTINVAAVRRLEQTCDVQQRRLAGARRTDECDRLAGVQLGRGTGQHLDAALALAKRAHEPVQLKDGWPHGFLQGSQVLGQEIHGMTAHGMTAHS